MPAILAQIVVFNAAFFFCLSVFAIDENSHRETPLVRAARECRGAIVNIHTEKSASGERDNRFFAPKERKVTGMGTGIVVDERGYIVTNRHVIHGVDQIIVTQDNGQTYLAHVVEDDKQHDLAIIRVFPTSNMKVMDIGTSSDIMLAEQVFAVGNAFGYEHTMTAGIISAISRDVEVDETQSYKNLIQTDASINPGNSGGPLLNLDGEVIGINVAIHAGAQRIGFAIPIDDARRVIAQLLSKASGNQTKHGLVGTDINASDDQHLLVDAVVPGSPAEESGLKPGDIVRRVRNFVITDQADWERALLELPPDQTMDVVVDRDEGTVALKFRFGVSKTWSSQVNLNQVSASGRPESGKSLTSGRTAKSGSEIAWRRFGIRVGSLSEGERKVLPSRYKGGMKILFVQSGGSGARHHLRNGDILVGLDGYETLAEQNLAFVLKDSRLKNRDTISFQIVRNGNQPLVGSIRLTQGRVRGR